MAKRDWWREAVFYQIYPRSFMDADGDGVGDLPGIVARLDHLGDLGVDAVWLSPHYPSPMADCGYDVSDYTGVHPDFGTLADFDRLVAELHRRGIRLIVDLVPNHTSDRHPWFLEARRSRTAAKRDWYVWADPAADGGPPNNWRSAFRRVGPAWTLDGTTGQYYLHHFLPQQPDLNWWNPAVRDAFDGILRFWLDRGVDGFRVDVAHAIVKDPELRDEPPRRSRRAPDVHDHHPETHEVLRRWRRILDAYGDRMAVGEVYLLDVARVVRYLGVDLDELDLAFNFWFLRRPWRASAFRDAVEEFERVLPAGAWPDYTLSNHDHSRTVSRYGETRARVAAAMLLTLRGTPFLYYGEELGMADVPIPPERVVDVDGRDPERTPMRWDASAAAGFTTGEPWLPIGPDLARVNVAVERDDPASMLSLYRRLIRLRRGSEALRRGAYRTHPSPAGVFAYLREHAAERVFVALNFTSSRRRVEGPRARGTLLLSTRMERVEGALSLRPLVLEPDEGVVVSL